MFFYSFNCFAHETLMFSMRKRGLDSKFFACGAYTWQESSWSINHLVVLRISIAETNSLLLHRSQIALLEFLGGWLGLAGSLGGLGVSSAVGWETRTVLNLAGGWTRTEKSGWVTYGSFVRRCLGNSNGRSFLGLLSGFQRRQFTWRRWSVSVGAWVNCEHGGVFNFLTQIEFGFKIRTYYYSSKTCISKQLEHHIVF